MTRILFQIKISVSASSSRAVLHHIVSQKLRVQVYWVGSHLDQVISLLDTSSVPYLVLHHTPSTLTLRYSMSPVMFPACKDPLLRRDDRDITCVYAPNRLAKVVWSPVQNEAPALFRWVNILKLRDRKNNWSGVVMKLWESQRSLE